MNQASAKRSKKLRSGQRIIEKFIYEDQSNLKDFSFYDDEDYLFCFF